VKQPEFDAFYRRSKDKCFRAVLASVGNTSEADDLLAEAYTRAWQKWDTVSTHPAPEAWIVLVAMNLHRDNWRSNRFWSRLRPASNVAAPELDLDLDLLKALRELPERQREVVVMRILLDHDTDQVAQALGIAPATVSVHLHRGLAALRLQVDATDNDPYDDNEMEYVR
jgi:RNA polymerase sigma-70 factor (ECF subfamily)